MGVTTVEVMTSVEIPAFTAHAYEHDRGGGDRFITVSVIDFSDYLERVASACDAAHAANDIAAVLRATKNEILGARLRRA